jgi:hypothetical protein
MEGDTMKLFLLTFAALLSLPVHAVRAAARSVHVVIKNNSHHALHNAHWELKHGIVTRKPPGRINPGGVGEMFAESNGVATGTEGFVRYQVEGVNGNAQFNWDNPFAGSNSARGGRAARLCRPADWR